MLNVNLKKSELVWETGKETGSNERAVIRLREGDVVEISVRHLFKMMKSITLGEIVADEDEGDYELFNDDGESACFNGEHCRISQVGKNLVTFSNSNGDGTVFFTLTLEEAEAALFPTDEVY